MVGRLYVISLNNRRQIQIILTPTSLTTGNQSMLVKDSNGEEWEGDWNTPSSLSISTFVDGFRIDSYTFGLNTMLWI